MVLRKPIYGEEPEPLYGEKPELAIGDFQVREGKDLLCLVVDGEASC